MTAVPPARARRPAGRRLALALAAIGWLVAVAAPPAALAAPSVGRATAEVAFLEAIVFEASAELSADVVRAEIVIDVEGSDRSIVAEVLETAPGSGRLVHALETPGGSIMPNTTVEARFRLTLEDGSVVDGRPVSVEYADTRFEWRTLAGEFVTVHWTEGDAAFGRRAVSIADAAVADVSDLLGVTETERIDFFVYGNRDAFYDVLGPASRENVGGQAHPDIRTLFANIGPAAIDDPWVGIVIPHELNHLVFDTAVANPYHYPPRWLNEGVAMYLSEGYDPGERRTVEEAADAGRLMPLRALAGQFPTTAEQFFLAYSESVSAVEFLVRTHDEQAMVELIRSYARGVTDDEAFEAAIGMDVEAFEGDWLASLGAPVPSPHGPVDPPPGPLPSDWLGEAPVPSDVAVPTDASSDAPDPPTKTPADAGPSGPLILGGIVAGGLALAALVWWLARANRRSAAVPVEPPDRPAP